MLKKDLSFLISINDDIATIKDHEELFITIFKKLHDFYNLKIGGISLLHKNKETLGVIIAQLEELSGFGKQMIWSKTFSAYLPPFDVLIKKPRITLLSTKHFYSMQKLSQELQPLEKVFKEKSADSLLFIPMYTGGELLGYLIFSLEGYTFHEDDTDYLIKIANIFASALSNAMAYEELQRKEEEKEMQIRLLLGLVTIKEKGIMYLKLAEEINKLLPTDYIALHTKQSDTKIFSTFCLTKDDNEKFKTINVTRPVMLSILTLTSNKILEQDGNHFEFTGEKFESLCEQAPHFKQLKEKQSIASIIVLRYAYKNVGELNLILGRKKPLHILQKIKNSELLSAQIKNSFFSVDEIELGLNLLPQLGLILANVYAFEEIQVLTKKLEQEKNYLLDEINLTNNFQEIIGSSNAIKNTLNKVQQVAPLDATVLIQGETGTGKELIASAVHNLSKRKDNAFITVNCAALPAQLIESELFGHEKGSFTGAIEKRIGKFEVADGGTIFLDEIGELPLEIQSKLLRVLQEKEFERLGGKSTIFSDVRIVAATNRDLEKEVEHGKFRADLFFRLNVFPIVVPPLRERTEDIPLLVKYFIEKYSKRIGKEVKSIKKNDLDVLMAYNWPGNIRELEHLVERAIIISEGSNLNFENLLTGTPVRNDTNIESFKSLIELEKEHIITALKISNGKITGEKSAAQLLGINGKTLGSKMRKFGIKREVVIKS